MSLHLISTCINSSLDGIHIYLLFGPIWRRFIILEISFCRYIHIIVMVKLFRGICSITTIDCMSNHFPIPLFSNSIFDPNTVPVFWIELCIICCFKLRILRMNSLTLSHRVVHISRGLFKWSCCISISYLKTGTRIRFVPS